MSKAFFPPMANPAKISKLAPPSIGIHGGGKQGGAEVPLDGCAMITDGISTTANIKRIGISLFIG